MKIFTFTPALASSNNSMALAFSSDSSKMQQAYVRALQLKNQHGLGCEQMMYALKAYNLSSAEAMTIMSKLYQGDDANQEAGSGFNQESIVGGLLMASVGAVFTFLSSFIFIGVIAVGLSMIFKGTFNA